MSINPNSHHLLDKQVDQLDGYCFVPAVLDRFEPIGGWDSPTLLDEQGRELRYMRHNRGKIRSRVELSTSGFITAGAGAVLAARMINVSVVPARWLSVNEAAGSPLDPYWVLFQHRLGWVGDRVVCRCAYTYPLRTTPAPYTLHPRHLADALWVAELLAPTLDVKQKAAQLLLAHQPAEDTSFGMIVDRCKCGAEFDADAEPGAWIQHRVRLLTAAGLIVTPRMSELIG